MKEVMLSKLTPGDCFAFSQRAALVYQYVGLITGVHLYREYHSRKLYVWSGDKLVYALI
ncbi:hypothetical protein SAMN04488132_1177 [Sediminibacterium ginsengisoli]|uniref:Uncharacterized protein n=1 Tax=Sediminibacterium ginsengisoli TaxID=413434 RepID=A0A1T4RZ07_9BACT|nr:hypothetical protein SAMN04488132_1177 [Sediminibacterium ginsengisoli]